MHITFTLNLQLATHWKENMYRPQIQISRVGSGRVGSGRVGSFLVWSLVGGNTKRKRTDQKRSGSVRVESFLFWWKRALRDTCYSVLIALLLNGHVYYLIALLAYCLLSYCVILNEWKLVSWPFVFMKCYIKEGGEETKRIKLQGFKLESD